MARKTQFEVKGRGEFPLDMLRSDRCYPKSESPDVSTMWRTFLPRSYAAGEVTITLEKPDGREPNAARWSSFGWTVQNVRHI